MPDMRALINGLEDYHAALVRQVEVVRGEFDAVERAWRLLGESFQGDSADEFRPVWETTERRFREYVERTTVLIRVLRERIEDLRAANRPTGRVG